MQFTAVRCRPGRTGQGRWSRLNRSEPPRPVNGQVTRSLRESERDGRGPRTAATRRTGKAQETADQSPCSVNRFVKPDAARQFETGETEPTERDGICPVRRGHRGRERLPETSETQVVWLITQRRPRTGSSPGAPNPGSRRHSGDLLYVPCRNRSQCAQPLHPGPAPPSRYRADAVQTRLRI